MCALTSFITDLYEHYLCYFKYIWESIIGYEMDTLCMDVSLLYQYATMISASKLVLHFAGPFLYSLPLWTGHISATCWCSRRLSWWIARLDDMPLLLIEPMCLHIIITYVMLIESMLITFRYILLLQQCWLKACWLSSTYLDKWVIRVTQCHPAVTLTGCVV